MGGREVGGREVLGRKEGQWGNGGMGNRGWGMGEKGVIYLFGLQARRRELGGHAAHVEIVEVDADVDLAGGDAVDADAGACAFHGDFSIKSIERVDFAGVRDGSYLSRQ